MAKKLFTNDLYIKVSENRFEAKNVSTKGHWESISPGGPFSTERLLVGTFSNAEPALAQLVKRIVPKSLIRRRPQMVVHPTSKVEGGLSEVEERIFKELALGAGAIKAILHVGSVLTDEQVSNLLENA